MNLVLRLPPETEVRLREQARLAGKQPEELALEALHDRLDSEETSATSMPVEAWLHEFDAWVRSHKSRNPHFDDSRESIYSDRS